MNNVFLRLFVKFQNLFTHEEGQDLPEYALVIALICLGATASLRSIADVIATEFGIIDTLLDNAI